MNRDMLDAAKQAGGMETGPTVRGWVQPRHQPDDKPEVVETEPEPPRRSTSNRPVPVDHTPAPTPTGGHEPHPLVLDHSAEIRELVDMAWRRQNG